jgi:hypothetical protein
MRLHHYSIHTELSYIDWIKRFVHFHHMQSRLEMAQGERKIEAFLTDLAVNGKIAASTQNQAMNALVFLYKRVLQTPLGRDIERGSRWPKSDRSGGVDTRGGVQGHCTDGGGAPIRYFKTG